MKNKLSDDFITLTTQLMMARGRSEIIHIASDYTALIERLVDLEKQDNGTTLQQKAKSVTTVIKFTEKEIQLMSSTFKKEFIANGLVSHVIKRESGRNSYCYEIRYRSNGYNITASSTNLAEAKKKFLEKTLPGQIEKYKTKNCFVGPNSIPTTFKAFTTYYFENFRKRKVGKQTYYNDENRLKVHIFPAFGETALNRITPADCQKLYENLRTQGKMKTADEVYSLMSVIFKGAIAHRIIERNPLDIVLRFKHETEHGKALTKDEENHLLSNAKGSTVEILYALALYTGLRPNELKTATIEGPFIVAVNSKRKTRTVEYKRIFICDRLAAYLQQSPTFPKLHDKYISMEFSKYCPNHKLYDLRTTFNTRCKELGVSDHARQHFMGHSLGALGNAYTDLSDEYLIEEGKKLNNW